MGVILASAGVCRAVPETISLTEGGITFNVARYDDGHINPYMLKVSLDDMLSVYTIDSAGQVTNMKVGSKTYKVRHCRIPWRTETV